MVLSTEIISRLLIKLKTLPPMRPHEPTFMEISGYPNFENVCSNILQFYFQPSNDHGFGTLLLDSLLSIIGSSFPDSREELDVRREEITSTNKRLDLVIENDDYVIGIENKIFADAYNDFKDYRSHLESLSQGRSCIGILLSLRPIQRNLDLNGFIPISYEQFFRKVLSSFGTYMLSAKESHLTFFRDFVKTLQNLEQTTTMDQQRLKYFHENETSIETLLDEINSLKDDMRRKVKQVETLLYSDTFSSPYPITHGLWRPKIGLRDVIWGQIRVTESLAFQVDVYVTLDGWRMQFFGRSRNEIEIWIAERGIEVETARSDAWRLQYVGKTNLPYDSNPETVQEWALEVIEKLVSPPA